MDIPAFGGRLEVSWAPGARVTSVGGLAYFATFLKATGLFERLCADFPVEYGSDANMREAESRGIVYLLKIRRSTHVRRLFRSLADGPGWKDCGFGWQAMEVSLRLDGWARGRRVLFIRRPAEKKVEVVEPKRRGRKKTPSPKDGVVVPTVPGRLSPCRPDGPPRGNHLAPGVHVDHGPDRRERAKANDPPHFHPCRFDAYPAGARHGRGVLQVAWLNCRAVGREDALDARRPLRIPQNPAPRPCPETSLRAQVAPRRRFYRTEPGFAGEAGRAALSRREKTPQLRFN